jgi:hypothetical protein
VGLLLAISRQSSIRLAEVAFLCILIAGIWMAVNELEQLRNHRLRMIVSGVLLAAAGLLLVIATHWGQFG